MIRKSSYLGIIATAMTLTSLASCTQEAIDRPRGEEQVVQANTPKAEQELAFARTLSSSISESRELRALLKKEALKQFDNNNDVLYHQVKDELLPSGKTVREELLGHWEGGEEAFRRLEASLPLLNIYLPDMSLFELSTDVAWDVEATEVGVAVREEGKENTSLFVEGKLATELEAGDVPTIPTLVVGTNKRVKVTSSARALSGETNFSYQFLDPAFDGSKRQHNARNAYVWEAEERDDVDASQFNWQTRQILESVRRGNPGAQRVSIYYPNDSVLDKSVNEQLLRFRISKEAYWQISDATRDPEILTDGRVVTYAQRNASIDELIARCWTDGSFTFVFEVHTPLKNGTTDVNRLTFNVTPKQLFMMNPDRERRHPTFFRKTRYTYRLHPDFLSPRWVYPAQITSSSAVRISGSWDLSEQGLSKKIFISELDPSETVTRTETVLDDFLAGAEASAELNVGIAKIKLGGKAEKKSSKGTTYTIVTQKDSDNLGTLLLHLNDPIIVAKDGDRYELFNVSNGIVTATFTPVKTSAYSLSQNPR